MKFSPAIWIAAGFGLCGSMVFAQGPDAPAAPAPVRPRILGISQVALYVHDLAVSRKFYGDFLGYAEPFALFKPDGSVASAFVKIDDHQTVELIPEAAPATDRLVHIGLETDNAEAMRLYLKSRGVEVPDHVTKGHVTAFYFSVKDPDGHAVEFMQQEPESGITRDYGQHLPATRISTHMSHAGIMVRHLAAAQKFYHDILGCTETWRGSGNGKRLSWVNMKVPDGTDWVEFMLYEKMPTLPHIGVSHHLCLLVPDVAKAGEILAGRPLPPGALLATQVIVGTDRKRQIHSFDPDGTRVEIMEPGPPDGVPAPSSDAPPPPG
jgi:catechol 2,3-dioxygenase-like lactoylglutathione lyase family enzyme